MFRQDFRFINEQFYRLKVAPDELDTLLAHGWRHFGEQFFRYNLGFYENEIRAVLPLRIRLTDFTFTKSQRRVLKKNQDLQTVIRSIEITREKEFLFERHKQRFKTGVPDSLDSFLSFDAAKVPCEALEVCVYAGEKLLAVSFFDLGANSISSVYAMFAPEESSRSLGILTMLIEINFALKHGKSFYYSGYAYEGNSFYDYKKRFHGLEKYDWLENWEGFSCE